MERRRYDLSRALRHLGDRMARTVCNKRVISQAVFERWSDRPVKGVRLYDHPFFGINKYVMNTKILQIWDDYSKMANNLALGDAPMVLEIGAGAGVLCALFFHDYKAKIHIVDLPEMISYSSVRLHALFPEATMILPHEFDKGSVGAADFVFSWPNQTDDVGNDAFDLCINIASMGEMRNEEIQTYFQFIQRVVRPGGAFYCSNRLSKRPTNMKIGDNEQRDFFSYPWNPNNEDILVEVNRLRYEQNKISSLTDFNASPPEKVPSSPFLEASSRTMPITTFLMSIKNGEPSVAEAADSQFVQTMGDFRFLILDKVATDRTREGIWAFRRTMNPTVPLVTSVFSNCVVG